MEMKRGNRYSVDNMSAQFAPTPLHATVADRSTDVTLTLSLPASVWTAMYEHGSDTVRAAMDAASDAEDRRAAMPFGFN